MFGLFHWSSLNVNPKRNMCIASMIRFTMLQTNNNQNTRTTLTYNTLKYFSSFQSYQPPVQDPAILAFQRSPTTNNYVGPVISQTNGSNNGVNNSIRETGVIEKLLHSYGFVQCCDRDARLFFHFSEYNGNIDTMKVGGK